MTYRIEKTCMVVVALMFYFLTPAQNTADTQTKKDSLQKKISISGMLLARFSQSFDKSIDVNGKYHFEDQVYSTSSFSLRRARVQAKAQITSRADAVVLLNLTDFIGNPSNKVLENAYLKYRFNDAINFQIGQFRPYFGREDLYPEELLPVLEWSNQYYVFGANGWQSFQLGATLLGKLNILKIPVNYYIGVFNGNGRNQLMDNNNGKLFPARIEFMLRRKTKLGLNGGLGKDGDEKVWAVNADVAHTEKLNDRWEIEIQSEYKRGTNRGTFDTSSECNKRIADYQASGFYVLPNLRYYINKRQVKSLELSIRYEVLNSDAKRNNSNKQTWMPVVSLQLADEYFLKFEIGLIIDRYSITSSDEHNSTRMVCQLHARF